MSYANSGGNKWFKFVGKKKFSPETIARKIPKKFDFSKVTNHPE